MHGIINKLEKKRKLFRMPKLVAIRIDFIPTLTILAEEAKLCLFGSWKKNQGKGAERWWWSGCYENRIQRFSYLQIYRGGVLIVLYFSLSLDKNLQS